MKNELADLFEKEINQSVEQNYKKLIVFIDAAMSQSFKLSGDDRAEFLVKNLLNMRDFMRSEVIIENTKLEIKDSVVALFDKFLSDHDLDLKELEIIKNKKKENESKEVQLSQESSSETDQSTLLNKEEN